MVMEDSFVRWKVLEAPPHAVAKEFVRNAGTMGRATEGGT
jgi:hypothetical protein